MRRTCLLVAIIVISSFSFAARKGNVASSGHVVHPSNFNDNSKFTQVFWIKALNAPQASPTAIPWGMFASTTTNAYFAWDGNAANIQGAQCFPTFSKATLTSTLSANIWYHIGITFDGTNIRIYLNGALQGTSGATTCPYSLGNYVAFEAGNNGTYFGGTLAEMGFWNNVVLTANQLKSLASGAMPQTVYPMLRPSGGRTNGVYWPLWGTSATEIDLSGNVNGAGVATNTTVVNHSPTGPYQPGAEEGN